MISIEEEQQVADYLIFHRLPLDVLLEVKDHMISQISDIQLNEKLSFNEAFHKTQKLWEDEFRTTTYSVFYSGGIPVILKKIVKEKYNVIIRKSLLLGLVALLVNFIFILTAESQDMYSNFSRIYNSLFVLTPFLYWIFNRDMRKYIKKDFKYEGKLFYTVYQQNLGVWIVYINLVFQFILKKDKYAFSFFRTDDPVSNFSLMIALVFPYMMYVIVLFLMINFFEHRKAFNKIKDFLDTSSN